MVKRNRIIYAILWGLSLVGISFFGGPVSYGFFTLMTLIPVIGCLYLLFVFFCFRIYQEVGGKDIVAGHALPFYFVLKNEFYMGFSSIRVGFFSELSDILDLDEDEEYELSPQTEIKKQTKVICKYKGYYEVGIKSVELTDYFGLLKIKFNNKETLRVSVKPAIVELVGLRSLNPNGKMTRESALYPTHPDVLVRRYEEGDDIRLADWRSAAKNGELMIRKTIGEEREGVGIILPLKRYGKKEGEYLPVENKMLECAIALANFFLGKNTTVNAYGADGTQGSHSPKKARFRELYDWFSKVTFAEDRDENSLYTPITGSAEIYRCKMVFFVVQRIDYATLSAIKSIQRQSIPIVVYLVSDSSDEIKGYNLPNTEFIQLSCEVDLREVM